MTYGHGHHKCELQDPVERWNTIPGRKKREKKQNQKTTEKVEGPVVSQKASRYDGCSRVSNVSRGKPQPNAPSVDRTSIVQAVTSPV